VRRRAIVAGMGQLPPRCQYARVALVAGTITLLPVHDPHAADAEPERATNVPTVARVTTPGNLSGVAIFRSLGIGQLVALT